MGAPVNVKSVDLTGVQRWPEEAPKWKALNTEIRGHPEFSALTVKGAYIIGVICGMCQSVGYLIRHPQVKEVAYIPAYGIFASGVELLGRCIRGNTGTSGSVEDLKTGFKWLLASSYDDYMSISEDTVFVMTTYSGYSIKRLANLRHFAAHGQATINDPITQIDYEILSGMPPKIANGLERYWSGGLQRSDELCLNLAKANIIPLRGWPIFKSFSLFSRDSSGRYRSVEEIFLSNFAGKWNVQ